MTPSAICFRETCGWVQSLEFGGIEDGHTRADQRRFYERFERVVSQSRGGKAERKCSLMREEHPCAVVIDPGVYQPCFGIFGVFVELYVRLHRCTTMTTQQLVPSCFEMFLNT